MAYETIDVARDEAVLIITLDRPDRLNAFNDLMQRELCHALGAADDDDDVRVVVVTGRGRAFCAGADLEAGADTFAGTHDEGESVGPRDTGGLVTLRLFAMNKPVIAAINGPAVGVGVTMTLAMDIRLAADGARFGFVFARRGIVPEACSSWFLPRVVGIGTALEWTLSGRIVGADDALAHGLVRSLHPADELLPAAMELAREIASSTSAVSVALTRQMMWRLLGAEHPMRAHELDTAAINHLGRSADAAEGVTSFLEKRAAVFTDTLTDALPGWFPPWPEPEYNPIS